MNNAQHVELLETVCNLKGMVALSGYSSEIYNDLLKGWTCHSTSSRISSGRGSAVRQECIWLNPSCSRSISQPGLFGELA
jgi:DNA adenine methylase